MLDNIVIVCLILFFGVTILFVVSKSLNKKYQYDLGYSDGHRDGYSDGFNAACEASQLMFDLYLNKK